MCSASLPPLGSQPQWPRVVRVDNITGTNSPQRHRLHLPWEQNVPSQDVDSDRKMAILEKRLYFLQQQHMETLGKLHQEIEHLRRENQDLQYQLIMREKQSGKGCSTSGSAKNSAQRRCTPEPEVAGPPPPPHTPVSVKQESQEPNQTEQGETPTPSVKVDIHARPGPPSGRDGSIGEPSLCLARTKPTGLLIGQSCMPVISLNPLLVNEAVGSPPRAPTLPECEYLIHQLWSTNHSQAQELLDLKAFLKEAASNKKWTPESEVLAKALLCHSPREQDIIRFPKIPAKGQSEKWVKAPVTSSDKVILPAMKPTVGLSPAERLKRSQAIQRNRFRRCVL